MSRKACPGSNGKQPQSIHRSIDPSLQILAIHEALRGGLRSTPKPSKRRISMETMLTANQLSGRAIGAIFFSSFGAIWIVLALFARQNLTVAAVSCVVLGSATLLCAAFWLLNQSKKFPRIPEDPAQTRTFNRINALQWIAIGCVAFGLNRLHLDAYVVSAITAIVGLHLFPLAKLFRYPVHYATA